ncbi:MAG: DUF4091 domain-containing protein [Propionibacteriaceae bacterium]|nr:DUF4091 domain-containing protein [Propionibacteriaceae bacterium]
MSSRSTLATLTDSLTKVLPTWEPSEPLRALTGWTGETLSFQVAWRPVPTDYAAPTTDVVLTVTGAEGIQLHAVDLVPIQVPCWEEHGDGFLTETPGMLPDVLRPLGPTSDGSVSLRATHIGWHSVWVDIEAPIDAVHVTMTADGQQILDVTLPVHLVDRALPEHGIENTQWFHADCLATHYGVETWSEAHWDIIRGQMQAAAQMGVTMLLTPVWTPPLDTAVGTYRRTTQLLEIGLADGTYSFGTKHLDRWLDTLAEAGISRVEVPHLFTQWGAEWTPKFEVWENGQRTDRFGWDTPATDPEYQRFLSQLIPFLKSYFAERVGLDKTVFHISDEPNEHHLDSYRRARDSVQELLDGCRVLDALSHPEYADLVQTPVVATDAVPSFRAVGTEPSWVYYCIAQSRDVSNRFIAQEAVRTRALGWQLYKFRAVGFLHWALNFYSRQLSRGAINPFAETSAGGGFISGDPFIVYPGPGGATWPSLRHRLMRDAFDDLAAARGAEEVLGRERVLSIIDPDGTLDYNAGWVSSEVWLGRRRQLDEAVARP